ncbi:hypothetical protein CSUI_001866 [Cystoisospora suis]|uniref:Uncharacterized protein n=1 Tax=Cystoisospora suis TaxID=483139 RepID=A0A2C6LB05_9APIC|nr:hypothetical protein CSUI_001866 [Cystoisospora suis]
MPFPGRVFASGSAISGRVLRPSYSVNASSFNCLLHRPTSISCAWCRTSTELRTAPVFGGCRLEIEPGTVASSESRNLKRIRSDGSRCCTFGTEGASDGLRRPLAGWPQGRLACSALTRGQAPLVFPPLCRRYISVGRTASCEKEEEPSSGIFTSTSITWSARKDGYSDEQPEKSPVQQLSPSDAVAVATNSLPSPDVSEIEEEEDTVRDPDQIVSALDKYIVGQTEAKKSLAITDGEDNRLRMRS